MSLLVARSAVAVNAAILDLGKWRFSFDSSLQKELRELGKLDLSLSQIKQANIFIDDEAF